ncbi:MAG: CsbD family protein [Mesorhizobium sp.]|uniref:CsbD family protein n=2 Tax=Mesorhizobium TaxID=68287 RepID=UPI000BAF2BBA|nr:MULTISPECIES: CsbD family protein [unclassified Mesorhizobium]TGV92279.1 CsbD family protein [Mesorhizobium sp. M00.F.Ca.ET.158.01.1.1]WIE90023.1 CsbD family protein [Mesorhizobium sp. WSM4875]AZO58296.1 CsbD family protein [Mesorhizobium sp. M1A.F.Ca.IN.022.06.1.1]MCT2579622.1 CsbD family protein [Mesorhizobium sp. P13.3]MDF3168202.1 CsbD family protein [Mesorhizobium sp. P16.1]
MVNRHQVAGIAKQVKGRLKQAAGKATGSRRLQVEGMSERIAGRVRKAYGDVKDKARKAL